MMRIITVIIALHLIWSVWKCRSSSSHIPGGLSVTWSGLLYCGRWSSCWFLSTMNPPMFQDLLQGFGSADDIRIQCHSVTSSAFRSSVQRRFHHNIVRRSWYFNWAHCWWAAKNVAQHMCSSVLIVWCETMRQKLDEPFESFLTKQ